MGRAESQEKIASGRQIPILAWYGIPAEETTLIRYKELKESGITLNFSSFPDAGAMSKALGIAQKAGIKMIVSCPELKTNPEETVKRFMNHPAVAGYMLRDEPSRADFPELGNWAKRIRTVDDNHFCYLNLFPNYANEQQLGTKTYKEHVDLFINEVPIQLLSFDHYPVIGDSLRPEWYENLEIFSEAARKAGKPFWAFALAVAHGPYPIPTVAQLRLQVYSDLAYGAQGIQYFTYWTPLDTVWKFNNGPITPEGKRTGVYDRIKVVNKEIKDLSGVFLDARVISIAHTGSTIPAGTKRLIKLPQPIKDLKTEGTGAVVSVLENGGNSYLVVVNRDFRNTMKLTIVCDTKVKKVLKDGSMVPANAYAGTILIDPGDIAIYRWSGDSEILSRHIESKDFPAIDEAFLHGYVHNLVNEVIDGQYIPALTIQCTDESIHKVEGQLEAGRTSYSVWTRDLYWGFLGWSQAGDDNVQDLMKSSLQLLIKAKNKNQAVGQSKVWPLNDERFYIPQAYTTGLVIAMDFFPWCSESQADFLSLAYNYWKMSGDSTFIASIWSEIVYVTQTLELLDTNGNSLPDALWGSYDYMWLKTKSEEPLMCAKTSLAYSSVAGLARMLGRDGYAARLEKLAATIKETMSQPVENGGLWKSEGSGGYFVQMRNIAKGSEKTEDLFIPYDNLVPIWCGMTSPEQDKAIFQKLDMDFDKIYNLKYGPMYCAPAGHSEKSVMDCSSVTWLAFLDIYLRGKKGYETNRGRIYNLLMQHSGDSGRILFPEGAGVYGSLTGGAGRSWDNGNFFHMLVCGIYGVEKSKEGIRISSPNPIRDLPLTELLNIRWKNAVYNIHWQGQGSRIAQILLDGNEIKPESGNFMLTSETGIHDVKVMLGT
ncbi:MAG: hypothetical protein WC865_16115 [Bacteroidales bacterium]